MRLLSYLLTRLRSWLSPAPTLVMSSGWLQGYRQTGESEIER